MTSFLWIISERTEGYDEDCFRENETTNKFKKRFHDRYTIVKVGPMEVTYMLEISSGFRMRAHHGQIKGF